MASFSKSLFSQWVKAVPSSPWSSNSAPDSLSQPKCFRTYANKIWSNSHPKLRSYLLPHPWCDDNINLLGAEASPDIWTPASDQDANNCYFFRRRSNLRTARYLFSFRMVLSLHWRVCSSSFRRGFPLSPRGVSGSPSCCGLLHTCCVIKLFNRMSIS